MRLDESRWIYAGGLTPEWRWVGRRRLDDVLARLRAIEKTVSQSAPAAVRSARYADGLRYFLRARGPERDRRAVHPGMDYWLFLWDKHFSLPCRPEDWRLHLSLFHGFAAGLALERGDRLELDLVLDPEARFNLYGTIFHLAFPKESALRPARLRLKDGRAEWAGPRNGKLAFSWEELRTLPEGETARDGAVLGRAPELAPGLAFEDRAWLLVHGVTMHGLARLDGEPRRRFLEVLRHALSDMAARDPLLHAELTDMLRLLVPLENPMKFGSVSSSYVNLKGSICLSHAEDPLLQAETLIHEFAHQKMNQLLTVEPLLEPGQAGQVFYSPWRKDARRLRGLLLGAHAFLNVARYLLRSVSSESFQRQEASDTMLNVALRLYQVESALRTCAMYGTYTEFGRRFLLGMWTELGVLFHGVQWFPPLLLAEARAAAAKHRAEHGLFDTGFHRDGACVDKVKRLAFLTPGELGPAPVEDAA